MAKLFADLPQALENSVEIARRCNLAIELGKPQAAGLPDAARDDDRRLPGFAKPKKGLDGQDSRSWRPSEEAEPRYGERLEFEIETILQMGFPGYFLIVADFINWAKNNGVPGRARAAARAPARWSRMRSASPTSIRCATTCCSSAS